MKKKLVFFIGGLNFGGMERVVFIAKELLQEDYEIKIVTLYQDNADYDAKEEYYNINVPPSKKKIFTFCKRLIGTLRMKKELKPDIIFSFGMYLNYLNVLSRYFSRNKACRVVGIRSYDWLTDPFLTSSTDRWIMRHADKVNSVSKLIAKDTERFWDIPQEQNHVIYNPYDVEYLQELSKEEIDDFIFEEKYYYIITMGRLCNQKGYNHLIRSMSEVIKKHSKVKLLILGNGDKKEQIKRMIESYGLQEVVLLLGGKKNPLKYVKRADLYVLSSLTEGFPNALSETMSIGTPVVSVNCKSGPSEILFECDNFIYEDKDFYVGDYGLLSREMLPDGEYSKKESNSSEKALAKAICYAYENQEKMLNLSKKAIEHMKVFNYKRFKNSLKNAIEN